MAAPTATNQDPMVAVPLALDRLRAAAQVIDDLLRFVLNIGIRVQSPHVIEGQTYLGLYLYPLVRLFACVRPF